MSAILAALVNGAILSALVTAAVSLALRIAPRRILNAATRYVAWWAALAVTILLPALYLPKASPPAVVQPPLNVSDTAGISFSGGAGQPWGPPPQPVAVAPRTTPVSAAAAPEARPKFLWPSFPIEIPASRWPPWALAVWVSAGVLMLIRLIVSWALLQRRKERAFDASALLGARADHWLVLCGSSRRGVRLAGSTEIAIPAAVGPLRPAILIPARLLGKMDENALDHIGLHEAAHLARRDDCALLVQRILEALFALHPVVRWIARQIDLEREIACDDFVLAVTGKSRTYAACLTRMVELSAGARPSPAAAAAGSHLARRVEMLLDKSRHIGTRPLRAHLAVIVASLAVMVWMAGRSPGLLAFAGPAGLPAPTALLSQLAAPLMMVQEAASQATTPPPAKPDELCSVKGKVVNQATGEPLRKAAIVFRSNGAGGIFKTTTGEAGEFEAVAIDPGIYNVSATRTGFLAAQYGAQKVGQAGTPLTLSPGQEATGVDFKMTPQSVITGRVLNADREPMANQIVSPMHVGYMGGRRTMQSAGSAVSNDLGEYRLAGLPPGSYYVLSRKTTSRTISTGGTGEDRSAKPRQEEYVATYYPGSIDTQGAVPLELKPGETVQGIDIKLSRLRTTRISGRVNNQSSQPGPITVSLLDRDDPNFLGTETRAGPQGQFEFRAVAPGSYTILATTPFGRDTRRLEQSVDVGTDPVENITLTLTDGFDIPGEVRVEGGARLDMRSLRINLRPPWIISGTDLPLPSDSPSEQGDFRFAKVNPNRYIVTIDNLPDGWYLKSAWMVERDVREKGVDLIGGGAAPLQLVLSERAGSVTGVVKDEKDAPVAGATVALVPQEASRKAQPMFYRSLKTDQSGGFRMRGLPPGAYKLYGWTIVPERAWVDADFLKPFESKAKAVTIRESGSPTVELKVIPAQE